ncbi:MAG: ABC transporter substrate-binding protein, partial [Oscillospiraceae bacterium]|nr:ABC transporter substrate-binding protein [Oscillospiraceae bacterium]
DSKDTIVEDMDSLTEQTGIPFVHIDATVQTAPEAYRLLGELTGKTEKAEELASWCEETYAMISELMAEVDAADARKTLLYCLGDAGINVIAEGSFHAETINTMSQNLAQLDEIVSSGMGNEVDLEQIMLWDPEVIVFAPDSIYDTVGEAAEWQNVSAISSGNYYKTPYGPYGWLSSPPSVQRYLGLIWLGALLYPDYIDYDLQEMVTEYYALFYDCELTDEMYNELIIGAMTAQA